MKAICNLLFRKKLAGMMETLFTEDDYRGALNRFLEICDAPEDTEEAGELEKLMYLMEEYEKENCP